VPNLFYWNEVDKGGHFGAFEQPKLSPRSWEGLQVTARLGICEFLPLTG